MVVLTETLYLPETAAKITQEKDATGMYEEHTFFLSVCILPTQANIKSNQLPSMDPSIHTREYTATSTNQYTAHLYPIEFCQAEQTCTPPGLDYSALPQESQPFFSDCSYQRIVSSDMSRAIFHSRKIIPNRICYSFERTCNIPIGANGYSAKGVISKDSKIKVVIIKIYVVYA